MFDLNNELCFTQLWTKSETITLGELTVTLDNSYDGTDRLAKSRVTLVTREGDEEIRRFETVRERYYPAVEVHALLDRAGFAVRESRDFNFAKNPRLGNVKTWWVAEKQ